MKKSKACKNCHRIVEDKDICPVCKTSQLTSNWKGHVTILDPEKSDIAKKLDISTPGKYAIRIAK